jgi:hypothetical protein
MSRMAVPNLSVVLAVCTQIAFVPGALAGPHDALIAKHAAANGVPEQLVRRVIRIESRGNATVVHRGNYGLMQIRLATARGVGYSGNAEGLLDPDINLTYAVKYLAGAYRAAGCDADRAVSYYKRGYYGAAKRECGDTSSPLVATAQVGVKVAATVKRDGAAAKPVDVIKPKMVRTETIVTPSTGQAAARPVGSFEPKRVAPPQPQPVAAAKLEPAASKIAEPKPAEQKLAGPKPAAAESAAKFELASVPLPPVRPEIEALVKRDVSPVRRHARPHMRADRKAKPDTSSAPDTKSTDDPVGVVSFLRKLVTPDKTSRKRAVEADADPPSHIPPPQ